MIFFIVILLAQNIYFLERNNQTQAKIDNIYNRKLDVAMLMSKVVRERSLHMLRMYLSRDAWERDEIFVSFHKMKLDFLELLGEMKALGFADNEKALFDKASVIINQTELLQNDIVERIQSGDDDRVHSDITDKDLPLEYKVLGYFDSLITIIRKNADKARAQAKKQYQQTMYTVAVIAGFIFIGVVFLTRRSLDQVKQIESGLIDEAETLSWDATHDALTNVYNRRWLQHKFEALKDGKENSTVLHSLLYIDLDEFKPVNDNYGHVVGDTFLCGITRELEKCIRHNDTLARMGGDEFAILLENCDIKKAEDIADCLIKRVQKYSLLHEGKKISIVGCSIGINGFSGSAVVFEQLIKLADSACYEAKKNGKNQSYTF